MVSESYDLDTVINLILKFRPATKNLFFLTFYSNSPTPHAILTFHELINVLVPFHIYYLSRCAKM